MNVSAIVGPRSPPEKVAYTTIFDINGPTLQ